MPLRAGSSTTGSMPRRSRRTSLSASGSNGEALDPSRNFKAFLYTLARHEIADYFRSDRYDRRRLRLDLLHDAEHVQEQFAAAYDADRLRQLVLDEIDRMPPSGGRFSG